MREYHVRIYAANIEVDKALWLKERIEKALNVAVTVNFKEVTPGYVLRFLDEERDQVNAELLLEALIEKMGVAPTQRILVVLGADGYVRGLNFVFGVGRSSLHGEIEPPVLWGALLGGALPLAHLKGKPARAGACSRPRALPGELRYAI
jgi:archaemetzincin